MKTIRWGILGAGRIAQTFTKSMAAVEASEIVAVGSNSFGKAKSFAEEFSIPMGFDSYSAVLDLEEVDIVYVANTHNFHYETVLSALRAGKAVLCEKPIAVNSKEFEGMAQLAKEKQLFLMEALWTRFLPATEAVKEWIKEGRIGEIHKVQASFSLAFDYDPQSRLFNPDLAGGALLDLGIYPLFLTNYIYDWECPHEISSRVEMAPSGVDAYGTYLFKYEKGRSATLSSGSLLYEPAVATIYGEKGRIELKEPFFGCEEIVLFQAEKEPEIKHFETLEGKQFYHEIEEANRCLRKGHIESQLMSWSHSRQLQQQMDSLRADWGLVYPNEKV